MQGKNDLHKLSARKDTTLHIASDTRVPGEGGGLYVPPNAVRQHSRWDHVHTGLISLYTSPTSIDFKCSFQTVPKFPQSPLIGLWQGVLTNPYQHMSSAAHLSVCVSRHFALAPEAKWCGLRVSHAERRSALRAQLLRDGRCAAGREQRIELRSMLAVQGVALGLPVRPACGSDRND